MEAPTGSGKTGIILGAAQMHLEVDEDARWLILCGTKVEQDQYMAGVVEGYPIASVRGKNNYHCMEESPTALRGVCNEGGCREIHADAAPCSLGHIKATVCPSNHAPLCPYYSDVSRASRSSVVVTNYAYGLAMLNYAPVLGNFDVIVCDEAHDLDKQLEGFISTKISKVQWERYEAPMSLPEWGKNESMQQWKEWAEEVLEDSSFVRWWQGRLYNSNPYREKAIDSLYHSVLSIPMLDDGYEVDSDDVSVTFTPVWLSPKETQRVLFGRADRVVAMSGTIPDNEGFAKMVGLDRSDFLVKRLPYCFPIENRPLFLDPVVKLTKKSKDISGLIEAVDEWLEGYDGYKGLIHSYSYEITRKITSLSIHSKRMVWHTDTRGRAEALKRFKESDEPLVLVSPSMEQAIDLPGDECEFILIPKLPWPYLGTKVMQKRAKNFQYYQSRTLLVLRQMMGRGNRRESDVCDIGILDAGATRFFKQVKGKLTEDVKEGLKEALA